MSSQSLTGGGSGDTRPHKPDTGGQRAQITQLLNMAGARAGTLPAARAIVPSAVQVSATQLIASQNFSTVLGNSLGQGDIKNALQIRAAVGAQSQTLLQTGQSQGVLHANISQSQPLIQAAAANAISQSQALIQGANAGAGLHPSGGGLIQQSLAAGNPNVVMPRGVVSPMQAQVASIIRQGLSPAIASQTGSSTAPAQVFTSAQIPRMSGQSHPATLKAPRQQPLTFPAPTTTPLLRPNHSASQLQTSAAGHQHVQLAAGNTQLGGAQLQGVTAQPQPAPYASNLVSQASGVQKPILPMRAHLAGAQVRGGSSSGPAAGASGSGGITGGPGPGATVAANVLTPKQQNLPASQHVEVPQKLPGGSIQISVQQSRTSQQHQQQQQDLQHARTTIAKLPPAAKPYAGAQHLAQQASNSQLQPSGPSKVLMSSQAVLQQAAPITHKIDHVRLNMHQVIRSSKPHNSVTTPQPGSVTVNANAAPGIARTQKIIVSQHNAQPGASLAPGTIITTVARTAAGMQGVRQKVMVSQIPVQQPQQQPPTGATGPSCPPHSTHHGPTGPQGPPGPTSKLIGGGGVPTGSGQAGALSASSMVAAVVAGATAGAGVHPSAIPTAKVPPQRHQVYPTSAIFNAAGAPPTSVTSQQEASHVTSHMMRAQHPVMQGGGQAMNSGGGRDHPTVSITSQQHPHGPQQHLVQCFHASQQPRTAVTSAPLQNEAAFRAKILTQTTHADRQGLAYPADAALLLQAGLLHHNVINGVPMFTGQAPTLTQRAGNQAMVSMDARSGAQLVSEGTKKDSVTTMTSSHLQNAMASTVQGQLMGHMTNVSTNQQQAQQTTGNIQASPRPSILRKRAYEGVSASTVKRQILNNSSMGPGSLTSVGPGSMTSVGPPPYLALQQQAPALASEDSNMTLSPVQSSTDTASSASEGTPSKVNKVKDGSDVTKGAKMEQTTHEPMENGDLQHNNNEASPRKKPRKQLLHVNTDDIKSPPTTAGAQGTTTADPRPLGPIPGCVENSVLGDDEEIERFSRAVSLRREQDEQADKRNPLQQQPEVSEFVDEDGVRWVRERCRPAVSTLLSHYHCAWKTKNNHYLRYTDVKIKEERRPTVNELSNQKHMLQKCSGWKMYHLAAQVEDLVDLENEVLSKMVEVREQVAPKHISCGGGPAGPGGGGLMTSSSKSSTLDDDLLSLVYELSQGNIQRNRLFVDQMLEAKSAMIKILDHKQRILSIVNKHHSKRPVKKKERV